MANLNRVLLIGNLTRDPELKILPSQTAVCELGMAVNRAWTDQSGQKKEEVMFVDCSAFGRTAETLAKYVKKGSPLFIEGRLKLDQWEAQDGSKRSKMRVIIESFQFLPTGQRREEEEEPARRATGPTRTAARTAPPRGAYAKAAAPIDPGYEPADDSIPEEDLPFD
jgi:single-strand DNA-binding protein